MTDNGASRALNVALTDRNETVVVTVRGEVDIASVPELQSALEQAQQRGGAPVVDMSGVGFMGSVGLSALLVAAEAAAPAQLRVVVSSAVRRPIEVTGLDKTLALFDSLDAAFA